MKYKKGDKVTVNNAWKYNTFAPYKVQGIVYLIWQDGDIGVETSNAGSMKVKLKDVIKGWK